MVLLAELVESFQQSGRNRESDMYLRPGQGSRRRFLEEGRKRRASPSRSHTPSHRQTSPLDHYSRTLNQ